MTDINPTQIATQLATLYVQKAQQRLGEENKTQKARSDALLQLQKALQECRSSLAGLGSKKSLLAMGASLSQDGIATVSAQPGAQAGQHSLFVERLARAQQLAFGTVGSVQAATAGTLGIRLAGGESFSVALGTADRDGNGQLSAEEIARAVNQAAGNSGKVAAMVLNSDGGSRLLLTAGNTGLKNAMTLDVSQVGDAALAAKLAAGSELTAAQDAKLWLGTPGSGVAIEQASNTVTAIGGVSLNLLRAQQAGEAPLTLKLGRNDGDTRANVQSVVNAYNGVLKALDSLSASGSADKKQAAGALAGDAGIRALRDRLNSLIRQPVGGVRLSELGISAGRDGQLTLDSQRLDKLLATRPEAVDQLLLGEGGKGLLGQSKDYLEQWLAPGKGLLHQRRDNAQRQQTQLDARQKNIDRQYDGAYQRYLAQYSQLQAMQQRMNKTLEMLSALPA